MTGNNLVDTFPLNRIVINPSGGDDDAAINAAITSLAGSGGGKVELGSGLFNIASAILMASNIVLQGQGRNLTVLRLKDNTPYSDNANVIFAKAGSSDMSGWAISDLSIDANRAGQQRIQNALTITALSRSGTVATATVASTATLVSGEFVFIKGAANGAYNGGFGITVLSATQFRYTVASGTDSTSGTIVCTTQDNAYNGICVRGSSTGGFSVKDWTIQNVETKNAGYHGIAVYGGCSNFGMSTIHSHHNGFRSIHVHASRTVTTQDYQLDAIRAHENAQDTTTGLQTGMLGGLFVCLANVTGVAVSNVTIWGEPGPALDISGNEGSFSVISTLTQTGGTASATTAQGHGFAVGDMINILGSTVAGYNGRISILTVPDATHFTYAVPSASAATAAGSMYALSALADNAVFSNFTIRDCGEGVRLGNAASNVALTNFSIKNMNKTAKNPGASGIGLKLNGGGTLAAFGVTVNGMVISDCSAWGVAADNAAMLWSNISLIGVIVRNNGSNTASVTGGMFFQKCNQLTLIGCQSVDNNAGSAAPRQVFISTSSNVRMSGCIIDAGTANYAALEVDATCSALQFSGNMFKRQTSGTAVILSATNSFFGKGQLVGTNTISNRGTGNRVEPVVALTKTANYLATVSDRLIRVDASAGNVVITLPGVVAAYGLETFRVKKIDASANTVTIQCAGAETMDGTNSKVLSTQYAGIAFESNNVTWDVV